MRDQLLKLGSNTEQFDLSFSHFFSSRFFLFFVFCFFFTLTTLTQANEQKSPRLVIIIDDLGNNLPLSERAARITGKITLSVLPHTPFGASTAELGHKLGKEIMLHVPMSNTHAYPLGKGGLYSNMNKEDFLLTLRQDLNSLPHLQGVNNHMGSQLTQERIPMEWLSAEMRSRGLYFVDSRTTDKTVAYDTAIHQAVPALKRDIFLDDDTNPIKINEQLNKAIILAKQRGFAVAIGHPYTNTLNAIDQALGQIQLSGVQLVSASSLLGEFTPASGFPSALITSSSLDYCPALPYFAWPQPKPDAAFSDILHRTFVDWLTID